MEPVFIWTVATTAAIILGVHGAYYGALCDACLKIGIGLEGALEGTTGFQDAITPPASTNSRITNWLATLLIAVAAWYHLGIAGVAIFVVVRFTVTLIFGVVLKADPPKKHFCRKVYRSMANRAADYVKTGDTMRAEAMKDLVDRFDRSRFARQLTK